MEEEEKREPPLRRVRVENFGCLRDVTVDLAPLMVLVGPNDSGKSTFLKALLTTSWATTAKDGWLSPFPNTSALKAQTFDGFGGEIGFGYEGRVGDRHYRYDTRIGIRASGFRPVQDRLSIDSLEIQRDSEGRLSFRSDPEAPPAGPFGGDWNLPSLHGFWSHADPSHTEEYKRFVGLYRVALPLVRCFSAIRLYSLRPEHLRLPLMPIDSGTEAGAMTTRLTPLGAGLANCIAELLLSGRDIMARIEDALKRDMPQVKRVDVRQRRHASQGAEAPLYYDLELVTRSDARIPSHAISDGVLLFLGYLYLVLGPDPASILLIEEPETGIHPGLLRRLMQLFRDMTTGAHGGPPTQIIITTHSPLLLNLVQPEEIRVFQRGEDGATTVTPFMSAPDIEKLLDYQGPGEIWINEGEDYLVGKQRS